MTPRPRPGRESYVLAALLVAQAICTTVFLFDISTDIADAGGLSQSDWHNWVELAATLGLVAGMVVEIRVLVRLLRRQAHDARALSIASGALHDLIEGWFEDWHLTASEADVAMFAIKGLSIAEIARMRGTAEATVKSQLNAVYRKAGVPGRAQLSSVLIEELLGRPLLPPEGHDAKATGTD